MVGVAVLLANAPLWAQPAVTAKPTTAPAKPATAPKAPPATPASPATVAAPVTAPSTTSRDAPGTKAGALVHLASEIAQALGTIPPETLVVVSPLATDVQAPKGDELAIKIGAQIAGRLPSARVHPQTATLAVARGISGRGATLLFVQLEIVKGELRATADLYPVVSNGWERLRNPAPGPKAHAFAGAPLDAETRTYLTPILLEQAQVHKAKHEEGEVLAVGCGDVDVDGGLELVLVSRVRVAIGKLRAGKFVVTKAAPWTSIASRAPVPFREPIASVLASPRGHRSEIFLGLSDRAPAVVDASLMTRRQLSGLPIAGADGDACAVPIPDQSAFEANVVACTVPEKGDPAILFQSPTPRFDAIASLDLVAKDGSVAKVVAAREANGKLRLRRTEAIGKPLEATIDGAGAQVALADLDLDGVPEIVTSTEANDDALVIASFQPKGQIVPRLKFPAKDGVRAIATCPPEDRGAPGLVAIVGQEVWLVR